VETEGLVRFELKNTKPIDLMELTDALSAFGEAYQDHAVSAGFDTEPGNVRLFVREVKTGSFIADLFSQAEQASLVIKHVEVAATFITHINDLVQFFLGVAAPKIEPTKKEAEQVFRIMDPVAKDFGSQLFLQVNNGDVHLHTHNYSSQQANAVQNSARRFVGPKIPVTEIRQDLLLRLHQVRGVASSKVGDRGVIEEISAHPAKLIFASEEAKTKVLSEAFPFNRIFVVDAEVKASGGKVALYRVLTVKDSFEKP
jgi:hypothetical protein